jgi:phosphoribosyl 1,2-cyclic phosphate phosphodiesterase
MPPVRLTFLGTAASEGYPAAFCDCANCRAARRLGGRNLRRRCAALVDDELLIDLGPDLVAAATALGRSLVSVRHCLLTHEHRDHLDPGNLEWRSFDGNVGVETLDLYGSPGALAAVGQPDPSAWKVRLHPLRPFEWRSVGRYRVAPVLARHSPRLVAMLYLVERDGRTVFYATDTTDLPDETIEWLRREGVRVDLLAMDHTFGLCDQADGHLNGARFVEQLGRLRAAGVLAEGARVYATHIAHDCNPPHDELAAHARACGYDVAYDGLVVDL